jgi:hypothetical protein
MMKKMIKYSNKTKVLTRESRMRRKKPKNHNRVGEGKISNLNDLYSILIVNSKNSNLINDFFNYCHLHQIHYQAS